MKHSFLLVNSIAILGLANLCYQVYLFVKTTNTINDLKTCMMKISIEIIGICIREGTMKNWERSQDGQLILQSAITTSFK